jgi:chromosome segregation ATPase
LAEQRFADMEKRALLEIDRERTASTKLQKALESERTAHASASERLRADYNAAQGAIGALREQIGSLQNAVDTLREERDREQVELQSARGELEAAIRQAAADCAREDQFRQELDRLRAIRAHTKPNLTRAVKSRQNIKKTRKHASTADE